MFLNVRIMNVAHFVFLITISVIMTGCGGGGGGSAGSTPIASTCGIAPSSSYTVNWDTVVDGDITGYRVYYGLTSPLNKTNSSFQDVGNVNSWIMHPSDYGYMSCDTVNIAVASIGGSKGISSLSTPISIVLD